eukprot:CCRYP_002689-RA/>CCRYP_002689-RA protein AED:0.52 eAED:0.52 QI:0/0/0/1/1/1/2/0/298
MGQHVTNQPAQTTTASATSTTRSCACRAPISKGGTHPEPTQQHPPCQHCSSPQPTSAPSPPRPLIRTTLPPNPMHIAQHTRSHHRPLEPNATKAIARRTHSKSALLTAAVASSSQHVAGFTPTKLGTSVLNHDSGIGTNDSGTNQHVQGTETFYVIDYDDIPFNRCKKITYSKVVCDVCPEKSDPDRICITIGGNRISYPGDVDTKTAPLELVKLMINSGLSHNNTKLCRFNISNFCLSTPLGCPEYIRIRIDDVPQEFISEYNLTHHVRDGWVYFQIIKGVYGLPQSDILANKLLET